MPKSAAKVIKKKVVRKRQKCVMCNLLTTKIQPELKVPVCSLVCSDGLVENYMEAVRERKEREREAERAA